MWQKGWLVILSLEINNLNENIGIHFSDFTFCALLFYKQEFSLRKTFIIGDFLKDSESDSILRKIIGPLDMDLFSSDGAFVLNRIWPCPLSYDQTVLLNLVTLN